MYLVGKEQTDSLADSKRQGKDGEPSGMESAGLETSQPAARSQHNTTSGRYLNTFVQCPEQSGKQSLSDFSHCVHPVLSAPFVSGFILCIAFSDREACLCFRSQWGIQATVSEDLGPGDPERPRMY